MAGVEISGLVKRYGSFTAVAGISLSIAEGEFLVLLGPSGCGKTTTLRCVAGLEDITDGEIRLGGQIVSKAGYSEAPERRELGMVFQSYAIWPHMTVAQNVAFGLQLKKLPKPDIDRRVKDALDVVGLGHLGDRSSSQLSGGQQQRIALARAIVLEPKVLLFDEPLSNLDAKLRERMRFELRELQQRLGITSIYVTHDQQEAMIVADRVVLMNKGEIEQIGSPGDIYQRPVSRFGAEFFGLANIFRGTVTESGTIATRVRTADGVEFVAPKSEFRAGTEIDVMFRPENVEILPGQPDGPNVFQATLAENYFLGNIADVFVQLGPLRLRSQISPPRALPIGEKTAIRIAPETISLLAVSKA
jgi:ABC-type Fe3+/spermidine/putrescine transport system ATPase subunit